MHGRLDGAPTADDLGIKGMRAVLYEQVMTNHHEGHKKERVLAGCRCVQISAAEVVPGDFRYHYSNQLDTFILWEVLSVDHERLVCEVKTIDVDCPEIDDYWDGEQSLVDGFNKFYRPNPEDRARIEKNGFDGDYSPMSLVHSRPAQRRHLSLKLNIFKLQPVHKKIVKDGGFLATIRRWLLGY